MQCNIKECLQKARDNSEEVKGFHFKPRSVGDVLGKSWGQVMHSSHTEAFQPHPCLENTLIFSCPSPWPGGSCSGGGTCQGPLPWGRRRLLATVTKAPETHSRTRRTKTNPERRAEFPCGCAENGSSDSFHLFSLLCVRIYYDTNLFGLQSFLRAFISSRSFRLFFFSPNFSRFFNILRWGFE